MQLFLMPENSLKRTIFVPDELLPGLALTNSGLAGCKTVQGGANITLGTKEAQRLQLGQTFASVRQITDSCFAIKNTFFNPITPKPLWYDELNSKFIIVKDYASQWLDHYAIAITSTIPASIMTFAPTFSNSAKLVMGILDSGSGALNQQELESIRAIFVRLLDKNREISKDINQYVRVENGVAVGKLVRWKNDMSDAGFALKSGSTNIQNATSSLTAEIEKFNGEIATLKKDIQSYDKLIATGAGLVGVGAIIGVIGFGLCFAFPVIGGIMLAIGVASVVGGASVWGFYQKKINQANDDILKYQKNVAANQQSVMALSLLSTSMDNAVYNAELATTNMVDFAASWLTFGTSLKNTIDAIENGELADKRWEIKLSIEDSLSYWEDAKAYAQKLLDIPSNIKTLPASDAA